MPRAVTELDTAISAAKEVFWQTGFDDTSVEDIVHATGLNRYALYSEFGGKLEIFLAVLEAYHLERKELFLRTLNDPDKSPLDAIREVSGFCIEQMANRHAGCLMCNIGIEGSRHDDIISERVDTYLNEVRAAKEGALTLAKERGELNPLISPKDGAALLVSNMLGSSALARRGASRLELMNLFNSLMNLLSNGKMSHQNDDERRPIAN